MGEVLPFQPKLQIPLAPRIRLDEADTGIALGVHPSYFSLHFHGALASGQRKSDLDWTCGR